MTVTCSPSFPGDAMPAAEHPEPHPPRRFRIRKTLRTLAIVAISFTAGVFVARTTDRPVAGTFREVVPAELMAKLMQPNGFHIEQMPMNQALPLISKTFGVKVHLYEHASKDL